MSNKHRVVGRTKKQKKTTSSKTVASVEYRAFHNARQKFINPKDPEWQWYGGRGLPFTITFQEMLAEIGKRPSPQRSLTRKNRDLGFIRGNLCWGYHRGHRLGH